jgi:hypothetical protein
MRLDLSNSSRNNNLRRKRDDLASMPTAPKKEPKASSQLVVEEVSKDGWRRERSQLLSLSAYDRHKTLVNEYLLFFPGATRNEGRRESTATLLSIGNAFFLS